MNKRRFMKKNEGYSLVEMIIVIAIIAVMTGAAMVTIAIIHNAKAKEAASTFEDVLAETQSNAKGKMCVIDGTQYPDYRFAVAVFKNGSKYYVQEGYYKGNGASLTDKNSYDFVNTKDLRSGKPVSFSAYVAVKYKANGATDESDIGLLDSESAGNQPVYIIYDRQGMCINGSGEFNFYRNSKNTLLSTVVLNKNGSHTSN